MIISSAAILLVPRPNLTDINEIWDNVQIQSWKIIETLHGLHDKRNETCSPFLFNLVFINIESVKIKSIKSSKAYDFGRIFQTIFERTYNSWNKFDIKSVILENNFKSCSSILSNDPLPWFSSPSNDFFFLSFFETGVVHVKIYDYSIVRIVRMIHAREYKTGGGEDGSRARIVSRKLSTNIGTRYAIKRDTGRLP